MSLNLEDNEFVKTVERWLRVKDYLLGGDFRPLFDGLSSKEMPQLPREVYGRVIPFMILKAENDLDRFKHTYIPISLHSNIRSHEGWRDFNTLLRRIEKPIMGQLTVEAFEAVRTLELMRRYTILTVGRDGWRPLLVRIFDQEKKESELEHDKILSFFKGRGIIKGGEKNEPLYIFYEENGERSKYILTQKQINAESFLFRKTELEKLYYEILEMSAIILPANPEIKLFWQIRAKNHLSIIAKSLRRESGIVSPLLNIDRHGIRFCYGSLGDKRRGEKFLSDMLMDISSELKVVSAKNRNSSRKINIDVQYAMMRGHHYEFQHMILLDYIDGEYSSGGENHILYHLRWYSEKGGLLDQLWPPEIYGFQWSDPYNREYMKKFIINKINKERSGRLKNFLDLTTT